MTFMFKLTFAQFYLFVWKQNVCVSKFYAPFELCTNCKNDLKKLTNWCKKHCHFKHVSFNSFPLLGKMFLLKHFSGIACRWTFCASFNFHFWLEQSRGFEEVGALWLEALLAPFQFHNFTSSFPFICIFTCKWMEMEEEGRRFFR